MALSKLFSQCPEFPSDIAVADIPTISYKKLKESSEEDSENLFRASREHGFFLLDLRGLEDGERLLESAETMFEINSAVFDLCHEELLRFKYNAPRDLMGYKAQGLLKTEGGKRDAMKVYTLSQDEMLGLNSSRQDPEPISSRRSDCENFFRHAHGVICDILSELDKHLGLIPGTLAAINPLNKPSDTSMRMLLSDPTVDDSRIAFGGHTDIGTITVLFNVVGGLQILPAGSENLHSNWRFVRPKPGCAVINIGDSLVEKTGGILRSALHRVITPPGKQASFPRQSIAYLVRPDHNGDMRRLDGKGVIPPLVEGEKEETRSVDDWATFKAQQIMNGEFKP